MVGRALPCSGCCWISASRRWKRTGSPAETGYSGIPRRRNDPGTRNPQRSIFGTLQHHRRLLFHGFLQSGGPVGASLLPVPAGSQSGVGQVLRFHLRLREAGEPAKPTKPVCAAWSALSLFLCCWAPLPSPAGPVPISTSRASSATH